MAFANPQEVILASTLVSQGTTLGISVAGAAAINVAGFKDFSGLGGGTATVIDTSDMSSASTKDKRVGLPDEGATKFTLNYVDLDAGQIALGAARLSRSLVTLIITLTSGTTYSFNGYVQTFEKSASVDQIVSVAVSVEITGAIVKGSNNGGPATIVGFVYLTDSDGAYLTDSDGAYLIEAA